MGAFVGLLLCVCCLIFLFAAYVLACTVQVTQVMNKASASSAMGMAAGGSLVNLTFSQALKLTFNMYGRGRFWLPYAQQPNLS